jgi:hypothetical protein
MIVSLRSVVHDMLPLCSVQLMEIFSSLAGKLLHSEEISGWTSEIALSLLTGHVWALGLHFF